MPVSEGDITRLGPDVLGLPPGDLDLLDSSPPCGPFSLTGLRGGASDPRGGLWKEVIRCAEAWQPKTVVIENVAGLVRGAMIEVFTAICRALSAAGYVVGARLLDAAALGCPQRRVRAFVIGVRSDLGAAPGVPRADDAAYHRTGSVRTGWTTPESTWSPRVRAHGSRRSPSLERADQRHCRRGVLRPNTLAASGCAWDAASHDAGPRGPDGHRERLPAPSGKQVPRRAGAGAYPGLPRPWDWCGLPYAEIHHLIGNCGRPAGRAGGGRGTIAAAQDAEYSFGRVAAAQRAKPSARLVHRQPL